MTPEERKVARERCEKAAGGHHMVAARMCMAALDALDAAEAENAELKQKRDAYVRDLLYLKSTSESRTAALNQLEADVIAAKEFAEKEIADLRRQLAEANAEIQRMLECNQELVQQLSVARDNRDDPYGW